MQLKQLEQSEKPVVVFIGQPQFYLWFDGVSEVAKLPVVLGHPKLGDCVNVRTSEVICKSDIGSFETRNTIYVPATKEQHDEYFRKVEDTIRNSQGDLAGD